MLSILVGIFGTSFATWLGHALTIRSQQLKGAPAPVAAAVQSVENNVVEPAAEAVLADAADAIAAPPAPGN